MHRPKPETGQIYHVFNRGVDKRSIFLEEEDYLRFIRSLCDFNDTIPTEVRLPENTAKKREHLVQILAFCLMPNHFHLMLQQDTEQGVTEFMRKLGTGYTNYFNKKYNRSGALFQGKYKVVHIAEEAHFLYLPFYIHVNPLDLKYAEWRDGKIHDEEEMLGFLESYRWSSYLDYIEKPNFPMATQRNFLKKILGNTADQKKEMLSWIKERGPENIENLTLE
ncbi:MAG: hypothetical protein A3C84_00985 [Candidatus Ryanbacteria bacterium RIFCSPHIGHO2_02_FULL_48_12]|uniref:Transposase IS200-like domain-containing protein n=1 Tax=Candidatus Ryanbacteria bacterium RIFCSPHIGHO2_01_FULL_48_27 TaxID=1802115 RepID=A0A1G2G4N7_9BACT|nr:MAG: hypothetical protein A2756_03495 [Candidatus Ryanbacteria bacterium RIFCSPHIGHO2_01_FULL_48_27]OGZ50694.1 MAG: hypothetical protein A3C84_00985 [Candidatus Ryanbacteria bacterium RIFCSPHIGHO2_02_FULL_48_12]